MTPLFGISIRRFLRLAACYVAIFVCALFPREARKQRIHHDKVPLMRPEAELLIVGAAVALGAPQHARLSQLAQQPLDWAEIERIALQHGLAALVYQGLRSVELAQPPAWLDRLRALAQQGAQQSLLLAGELIRLLRALDAAGIAVLNLKGAVLAAAAYGNLALRQFVDIDILVQPRDLPRARDVLATHGYQCDEQIDRARESDYLRLQHHYSYRRPGGVLVELHFKLRERFFAFAIDHDAIWRRSVEAELGGLRVRCLAPEDAVLTLCAHGAGHCWERLIWVCDIAALLRANPQLRWAELLARAEALGGMRMLLLGLLLAHDLVGAELPPEVLARARADGALRGLARQVLAKLFRQPEDVRGLAETAWFYLRARERRSDRVRFVVRLLFTPTLGDWSLVRLPQAFSFAYYLLRPFRLLGLLLARRLDPAS